MNTFERSSRFLAWFAALLLVAMMAGCGGGSEGRDPILGIGGGVAGLAPVVPDTTRPRVTVTVPANAAINVFTNTAITAVFTEDMAPATITAPGTFAVTCLAPCVTPVAGVVTYVVATRQLVFTPAAPLAINQLYTATITTAATDLAGNQLAGNLAPLPAASNFVWTFTTGALPDAIAPTVTLTSPANLAAGVAINSAVNATFSESMAPATITAPGTFTLQVTGPPLGPALAGTVTYAPLTNIATFTPAVNLLANTNYTATVTAAATDLAGNALVAGVVPNPWTFTTGGGLAPGAVALGTASTFGTFGGSAGMTNQGLLTIINGDIGTTAVSTAVTGFHDAGPGCTYTETALNVGLVNGLIYTAPPPPTVGCPTEGTGTAAPPTGTFGIATVARADALAAYNTLAGLAPTGPIAANLSGLTVPPGVYFSAAGFLIQDGLVGPAGDLTLDGQGNANAVWVFQSASTLTVGGPGAAFPRSVNCINGCQPKNVFWQVGSTATINAGGGGIMVGTIIAQQGVIISTAGSVTLVTLEGRALSLVASVTMVNTVINVPAP